MASTYKLILTRGDTLSRVLRWSKKPVVYKAVTAVIARSPLRLTVVAHAMQSNWRAALTDIGGMDEANAVSTLNKPGKAPLAK